MQLIFYFVFGPANLFVGHPERGLQMAICFAILLVAAIVRSRKIMTSTHFLLLASTGLWALQSIEEVYAQQKGWDIRVDIFFLWPPLVAISILTVCCAGIDLFAGKPRDPNADNA